MLAKPTVLAPSDDVPQTIEIEKLLLTPFGEAEASHMWVPDSPDAASEFLCWILETNESWWFPQALVRGVRSMSSHRRGRPSEIVLPEPMLERYANHIMRHKNSPFYERAKAYLAGRK